MKNNKGLVIAVIIILSVFVILLSILLGFLLVNKNYFKFTKFNIVSKDIKVYDREFLASDFTTININSDSCDISIRKTNSDKIKVLVFGRNSNDVKVEDSNNTLNINYKVSDKCIGFCFYKQGIEILVPNDYKLNSKIYSKYGDIDIDNFNDGKLVINSDSGDIDIKSISDVSINSNSGDIEISNVYNMVNIKSNSGDIDIDRANITSNSKITSNYGDVEIDDINDIWIDAKTNLGDVEISKNNRYSKISLVIKNNSGDIEIGD